MPTQIVARSPAKFALLAQVHGGGRCREMTPLAKSHFDKDDCCTVQHDQVDLAEATTEITLQQSKAVARQMNQCQLFSALC